MRKRNSLLLKCVIVFASVLSSQLFAAQPHIQRSGTNLVSNSTISGSTGWTIGGSAVYDPNVSKSAGSGSLKLTIPYPTSNYSYVQSGLISVTPGTTYTHAFYMYSNIFPPPGPLMRVFYYNSSGTYIRNAPSTLESVTNSNSWQECVYLFRPQAGEVYVKIDCTLYFQPNGSSGSIWLDNFYLGTGIGFEQAPAAKTAFNGSQTKVDALGNVEIYKNGVWTPFFPIGIYADGSRVDWSVYSNQGFNTQMWANQYADILKAKNATSTFNPDGMMSGFQIAGYISPSLPNYNNITLLTSTINQIISYGLMNSLLWYYWDNENCPGEWAVPLAVTNQIRNLDKDAGNNLMHPIYCLQGDEGLSRKYNTGTITMTDVIGTYVTQDTAATYPDETRGALRLVTIDNVEQQKNPVVMAQINNGIGLLFRPRVFTAIAKGAKGIGFWKDGGTAGTIENQPWWSDLPNIRNEIDQLLPVIRMPHWTSWSLSSNNSLTNYGTRDYQGKGYVIVTNEQSTEQSVTFTISSLPYTAAAVKNYFTHKIEAGVNSNQFTVKVPAYGSKVYVLENNIEEMLTLKLLCNESATTAYDGSYFANNGTLLNGALFSSGSISLDGTDDRVNCGHNDTLEIGALDMTITARVKLSATQNTYAGIVTKGAGSQTDAGYTFMYNNGTLNLWLSNGTTRVNAISSSVAITDNAWHTVGVSVTRSGNASFYVDGNSAGNSSVSSIASYNIVNASRDLLIGSWINSWHLRGLVDNIRIYKKALSSTEMADLSGNIILDMQLNEASGTTAYDSSSSSSNGTLYGNAALGGGTLTLDGNGDYADCGHPSVMEMGVNNMTIIARIKLYQTQNTYCGIVTKGAGAPTDAGYTFMYNNGTLNFWLSNGTTRVNAISSSVAITDNAWHTVGVSVTRSGNAVFYVDGSSAGSSSVSSVASANIVNANRNLLLGSWLSYSAYSLRGSMDYTKIFKRALTSTEMIDATR